jgi:hypothetical protein
MPCCFCIEKHLEKHLTPTVHLAHEHDGRGILCALLALSGVWTGMCGMRELFTNMVHGPRTTESSAHSLDRPDTKFRKTTSFGPCFTKQKPEIESPS